MQIVSSFPVLNIFHILLEAMYFYILEEGDISIHHVTHRVSIDSLFLQDVIDVTEDLLSFAAIVETLLLGRNRFILDHLLLLTDLLPFSPTHLV